MDITEFFQLSAGKWFSHRTSHHLGVKQTEGGKSDLRIEILSKTDPTVVQLCQQYEVDPALALCGSRATWNGLTEWTKEKHGANSTVLVAIADPQKPNEGKLLREMGNTAKAPVSGRYIVGADDALTLIVEDETTYSEERLWFASPNLRLRTSILKQFGGFSRASFCSEIRKGDAQQPAATTQSGSEAAP